MTGGGDGGGVVLAADSVGRRFGRREVLKAATIWAREGEITALLGRNGTGKTTLLRVAAGRLAADRGIVRYRGEVYVHPRLHRMARRGLFYLPQQGLLPRGRSLRKVAVALLRAYSDVGDGPEPLEAWADRWELGPLLGSTDAELSGGERNRAGVALAVLRRPVCLLTDEPLTGAAPRDRARIDEALRLLRDGGCAVVVTGHEARDLLSMADRVVWMVAGTTRDMGPPPEAVTSHQFRREYLGLDFDAEALARPVADRPRTPVRTGVSARVVRHPDAAAFLDRAGPWLLEREAEHNLILGIANSLMGGDHEYEAPVYLATVEEGDEVVGCAWRTPPFKVGLTRMPLAAVPTLAADLAGVYDEIEAVLGPEDVAEAFARAWADPRGLEVRPGMRQRIYRLTEVSPPPRRPSGRMRLAGPDDRARLVAWWEAFREEAGVGGPEDAGASVDRRLEEGRLWVWVDDEVVSMAGAAGRTAHGVRIGPVYTPPAERGKGFATALVAELSRRLLEEGRTLCFLYTDLSNPTSNAIYSRIGYRPVVEVRDFHFGAVRP